MLDNCKSDDKGTDILMPRKTIDIMRFKFQFSKHLLQYLKTKINESCTEGTKDFTIIDLNLHISNKNFSIVLYSNKSFSLKIIPLFLSESNQKLESLIKNFYDNDTNIFDLESFQFELENILSEDIKKILKLTSEENTDIKILNIYTKSKKTENGELILYNKIVERKNNENNKIWIKSLNN